MSDRLTTDHHDPRLGRVEPDGRQEAYLVLPEEERTTERVRPVRTSYVHVGPPGPQYPLRDLTEEERARHAGYGYVKYEPYPPERAPTLGRFWTQGDLDRAGQGCGAVTVMGPALAQTYARDPSFYGATFCAGCGRHFPVGRDGEFVWDGTQERVGT